MKAKLIRRPAWTILILLLTTTIAFGQIEEARRAIQNREFIRAIDLLSQALASQPSADAYLYLGIAYGNIKEYQKAEDVLHEGAERYSDDVRFHNELAGVYLATRDLDKAKSELHHALDVDPHNNYASDLLASIDISTGEIQSALRSWNKTGRPIIDDILHNYYLNFGAWYVRQAVAFHPSGVLRYGQWRTTEERLYATDVFTNVGLEVEPTRIPDHYDAIIRTTSKTNSIKDVDGQVNLGWDAIKGFPFDTTYLNLWNIGNSGINFNALYRWDLYRRRLSGSVYIPIKFPGLLHVRLSDARRSEEWDLSHTVRDNYADRAHRLDYLANGIRAELSSVPHYRFEVAGGFEYVDRYAKGSLPELASDSRKDGRFFAATNLRLVDRTLYKDRLRLEGFAARKSVVGDFNYSGGTAEFANRIVLSKDSRTDLNWSLKGGTSRGALPVEDYFRLGVDLYTENVLRGHDLADHGRYGRAPMGSDFALGNVDADRQVARIPMFNYFNLPYVLVKGMGFFDAARTWDRTHIFKDSELLLDTGAGLRLESPSSTFTIVYGRALRGGHPVLYGYVERRIF